MTGGFAGVLLALCFFLSGLAALVYQTAWTREFAFVFGTSELAVATVLGAYMAGLAAGAAIGGRLAARLRSPVFAYGVLELGIALAALAVPLGIAGANAVLLHFFGGRSGLPDDTQLAVSIYYLVASFAILMVPTAMMGATLPLLARHAVEDDAHLGSRIGALYAVNTSGAVAGTLLTAFVLLPELGLRATVWTAVALNVLVFVLAVWLARIAPAPHAEEAGQADAAAPPSSGNWILPLMTLSGVVSFTYEVLWTRILSHLLGGSVYAFATMLASFLLGIAIGSAVASRFAKTARGAAFGFSVAQVGAGTLSLLAFLALDRIPGLVPGAMSGMEGLERGALVAIAVLLPGALCIGATFPLAVRIVARSAADAGSASARAYTWNTVGSIFGAVLAAFWVLPTLGLEGTVRAAAFVNLALAAAALLLSGGSSGATEGHRARAVVPAVLALAVLALPLSPPWRLLAPDVERLDPESIRHFAVGRSATVLLNDSGPASWQLRTNGLPESTITSAATSAGTHRTARWLSYLPALLRPDAKELVVIGLGGGVSVEALPASYEHVHVIELEAEVVEANRIAGPWRFHDPLEDPRVTLLVNDARSSLLLTGDRFGAITAQASHPWTAGSSHLYSRQFFDLIASRLTDDGVFVQWMGLGFVDEALFRSIVATMRAVWPHVRVYQTPGGGLLFAGSGEPFGPRFDGTLLQRDPTTSAFVGVASVEDLAANLLLDEDGAQRFAEGAPVITDDRNLLQMRSPTVVGTRRSLIHRWPAALSELDPLVGASDGVRPVKLVASLVARRELERAQRVADAIDAPDERALATALIRLAEGKRGAARLALETALERDPTQPLARATLLRLDQGSVADGSWPDGLEADASPAETAVTAAWRAERARDWAALEALDPRLAEIQPADPLAIEAALLRVAWRNGAGRAQDEVGAIVDAVLPLVNDGRELLLAKARAASATRDDALLLSVAARLARSPLTATMRSELVRQVESADESLWKGFVLQELRRRKVGRS